MLTPSEISGFDHTDSLGPPLPLGLLFLRLSHAWPWGDEGTGFNHAVKVVSVPNRADPRARHSVARVVRVVGLMIG